MTAQPRQAALSASFRNRLLEIVGEGGLLTSSAERVAYSWDNTGLPFLPQAVVLPENRAEVVAIVRLCHEADVPITPRGAGTGNVGGALPVAGGVVLSLQRMKRILAVEPADRLAIVEPGVVNGDLQAALRPHGLFWPPDPSSARSCTIGGNLAMCSAGPNAVRYGVTRDWVLGLTAVLADGTVLRTGGKTTKGVVGYDLTRLLIGSEGTLAVITEAILKLAPRPACRRLLRALFAQVEEATQAVSALMAAGEPLAAIEFLDPASLDLLRRNRVVEIPVEGKALLLLEVVGGTAEVERLVEETMARLARFHPLEIARSEGEEDAAKLWEARTALSPTLKKLAPRRVNEDVVVPVSRLPELIAGLAAISRESGIPIVNFGHAGNGNIHVNLLADPADPAILPVLEQALARVFRLVLQLQGTLSGEHGVGLQKRPYIGWELDETNMAMQRQIKALFDPKGILNPGKIFA